MPWWLAPAMIGGAMLVARQKAAARFRWYSGSEDALKRMPPAVFFLNVKTGDALPAAPGGHRWKEVRIVFAPSPFAPPEDIAVHVLEPFIGAPRPEGASSFATADLLGQLLGSAPVPSIGDDGEPQYMAEVVRREEYLYAPQTPPDIGDPDVEWELDGFDSLGRARFRRVRRRARRAARPLRRPSALLRRRLALRRPRFPGEPPEAPEPAEATAPEGAEGFLAGVGAAADEALRRVGEDLRARGLALVPIPPGRATTGDFVVTSDCRLHAVEGEHVGFPKTLALRELHPSRGRRSVWRSGTHPPLACAFGVRRG